MNQELDMRIRDSFMILNASPGIGPVLTSRLMENFHHDPLKILDAADSQLQSVRGVGRQSIDSMRQILKSKWIDKEKQKLQQLGGYFVHNNEIPENLTQLNDSPLGLYCLGEIPKLPYVSIVGTRVPSLYGKKFARKIGYELAKCGICVVSGMARGIDSEAHHGALEADGKTIAFLGSGIDVIYPPENLELYNKIKKSGAILSEFPLGRRADRRTFPMRNRLVAGISLAVVVIESAKSGGSMITARFAAEQGRTVFALPGRVDQPESQGCLDLIRDGASLIRSTNDILEELAPMLAHSKNANLSRDEPITQDFSDLNKAEQLIMSVLSNGERMQTEDFQATTQMPLNDILTSLTMLEIRGVIQKRADGKFEASL